MQNILIYYFKENIMALIKWRDSYSVGVEQFDNEHKTILRLINEMFEVVKDKHDQISVNYEVDKLINYTKKHFRNEETALEQAEFELLDEHKAIHKRLVREAIDFKEKIENNTDGINSDFYLFLRDWLLKHILEEDMKYSVCFS